MGHTIGYSSTNFMTHLFSSFRTVFMGPKYSKSVGHKNGEKFTIFVSHIITTSICDFMDQKSAYKITIFLEPIIYAILWARKKWSPRRDRVASAIMSGPGPLTPSISAKTSLRRTPPSSASRPGPPLALAGVARPFSRGALLRERPSLRATRPANNTSNYELDYQYDCEIIVWKTR